MLKCWLEILFSIFILTGLIRNFEEKVQPLIVPAVLEHEEVGIGANKPGGFRARTSSLRELDSPDGSKQKPTDALIQELTSHYKVKLINFQVYLPGC